MFEVDVAELQLAVLIHGRLSNFFAKTDVKKKTGVKARFCAYFFFFFHKSIAAAAVIGTTPPEIIPPHPFAGFGSSG